MLHVGVVAFVFFFSEQSPNVINLCPFGDGTKALVGGAQNLLGLLLAEVCVSKR